METADPSNPCIKKVPFTASALSASQSFNHFRFDPSSTQCFELAHLYQKCYWKRLAAVRQFGRLGMIPGHQGASTLITQ
jgi:hypothetical protein